ncbi:hypothetical protein [Dendrosporobacter sp. 1207_IL3150]|uniref:hypothetical protein n=1 Tax=Dendrosporobacter sp. 1207_IL3150 TaxID=3084054 RepID=UPI002FDAAC9C
MNKNKGIQPVGAIASILKAKQLGKVRVFKRPEYLPNPKKKKTATQDDSKEHDRDQLSNFAKQSLDGVGGLVDFKI